MPNSHIIVTSQTKSNHWHSLCCFPPARRRPIPPPPCVQHCSFMPARLVFAASAAALSFQLPARAAAGRHSACTNTQLRHTHEARSHILHCMPQSGRPSLSEQTSAESTRRRRQVVSLGLTRFYEKIITKLWMHTLFESECGSSSVDDQMP